VSGDDQPDYNSPAEALRDVNNESEARPTGSALTTALK